MVSALEEHINRVCSGTSLLFGTPTRPKRGHGSSPLVSLLHHVLIHTPYRNVGRLEASNINARGCTDIQMGL